MRAHVGFLIRHIECGIDYRCPWIDFGCSVLLKGRRVALISSLTNPALHLYHPIAGKTSFPFSPALPCFQCGFRGLFVSIGGRLLTGDLVPLFMSWKWQELLLVTECCCPTNEMGLLPAEECCPANGRRGYGPRCTRVDGMPSVTDGRT